MSGRYDFKVGDRVRFKTWERLIKDYGKTDDGHIVLPSEVWFTPSMRELCGTFATIKRIKNNGEIELSEMEMDTKLRFCYTTEMITHTRNRKKKRNKVGDSKDKSPKRKFDIGDRVVAVKPVGDNQVVGVDGKIVDIDTGHPQVYCVEFDSNIDGHSGGYHGKAGHCWWVKPSEIAPARIQKKNSLPTGLEYEDDDESENVCDKEFIFVPDEKAEIVAVLKDIRDILDKLVEKRKPNIVELLKDLFKDN